MAESLALVVIIAWNILLIIIGSKMSRVHRDTVEVYGDSSKEEKFAIPNRVKTYAHILQGIRAYEKEVSVIAEAKRNAIEKEGLDV